MGKKRAIKISVPNPCTEDWDKMTPEEIGRFCLQCNKTVIDFSSFTDKELCDYLKNLKGSFCGNFNPSQLEKLIAIQEPAKGSVLNKLLLGASLAVGVEALAQTHAKFHSHSRRVQTPSQLEKKDNLNPIPPIENSTNIIQESLIPPPLNNTCNSHNIRGGGVVTQYIVDGKKALSPKEGQKTDMPKN